MDTKEKVRENRMRRALYRRGYRLAKFRRTDPGNYGKYVIIDLRLNSIVAGTADGHLDNLDDVEEWVSENDRE